MITQGRQNIRWLSIGRNQVTYLSRGRYNISLSPYSTEATAALLAQFQTKWPTILDYGFAHPALVPFINEDPMLVMSLIEGLGTRWLVGTGTGYFDSGVKAMPATTAKCKVRYDSSQSTRMDIFGERSDANNHQYSFYVSYSTNFAPNYLRFLNGSNTETALLLNSGIYEIELEPNVFKINESQYSCGTNVGSQYNIIVMGVRYNETNNGKGMNGQGMDALIMKNTSGGDKWFIPFKRNGQMELLDLVSGNLATRVGTFTELIESPS